MTTRVPLRIYDTLTPSLGLGFWVQVPEVAPRRDDHFYAIYQDEQRSLVRTEVVARLNFPHAIEGFEGVTPGGESPSITLPLISEGAELARTLHSRPDLVSDPFTYWLEFPASSRHELEKLKLRASESIYKSVVEYDGPVWPGGPDKRLLLVELYEEFMLYMPEIQDRFVTDEGGTVIYGLPEVIDILETRRDIQGYRNLIKVPKALKKLVQKKLPESGAGGARDLIRGLMTAATTSQELDKTTAAVAVMYAEVVRDFQSAGHLTDLDSRGCARLIVNYWGSGDSGLRDLLTKSHGPLPATENPVPPSPIETDDSEKIAETPTVTKKPAKKPATKKTPTKKPATKKPATKKPATKKTPTKKTEAEPVEALAWTKTPTQSEGVESKETKLADGSKLRIVVDASNIAMLFREEGKHVEPIACGVLAEMERRAIEVAEQVRKENPGKPRKKRGRRCSVPENKNASTKDVLAGARRIVARSTVRT